MLMKYDTTAMDETAATLAKQHADLQQQVLSAWNDLITQATTLPTFATMEEPRQVLSDTIPSLTRLMALRKYIADKVATDSATMRRQDQQMAHLK